MHQAHKARLVKLFHLILAAPTVHFNMNAWRYDKKRKSNEVPNEAIIEHKCGTTACALGWAAADPEFNRSGLRFDEFTPEFKSKHTGSRHSGFDAGTFFGLMYRESHDLFNVTDKRNPQAMQKKIFLGRLLNVLQDKNVVDAAGLKELTRLYAKLK